MAMFLRLIQLLAIVVWVGGIAFFAFVLAPTAFSVLPSAHEAGLIVGATLRPLHNIGLVLWRTLHGCDRRSVRPCSHAHPWPL